MIGGFHRLTYYLPTGAECSPRLSLTSPDLKFPLHLDLHRDRQRSFLFHLMPRAPMPLNSFNLLSFRSPLCRTISSQWKSRIAPHHPIPPSLSYPTAGDQENKKIKNKNLRLFFSAQSFPISHIAFMAIRPASGAMKIARALTMPSRYSPI